jgi:hypothetical protein
VNPKHHVESVWKGDGRAIACAANKLDKMIPSDCQARQISKSLPFRAEVRQEAGAPSKKIRAPRKKSRRK